MATENPRVWFKSISLENVRSFGTKQTINFTDKEGNAARWNVILGDNGTGKTTVLKGLFLTNLSISVRGEVNHDPFNSHSLLRGFDKESILGLVYDKEPYSGSIVGIKLSGNLYNNALTVIWGTEASNLVGHIDSVRGSKISVHGYGANRLVSEMSLRETGSSALSLFDEKVSLIAAETWLMDAEFVSLKKPELIKHYNTVKTILLKLFGNEITDFETRVDFVDPVVYCKTNYGDVRMRELSLGYKTLIAWMVDFAKGLLDRYPDSLNPLAEPAVCLVDEIDLHLHPKFQRTIIQFLTDTFENTQFIVKAHSPLIVLAAEERPLDANIILLKREGDHTVVVNDPVDVGKWSVDQILNSDLFGYVPPASEPLTELRVERDALLAKPALGKNEQARLTELDEKIGFIPFGNNQDEIKAETIIQQLANALRSQQEAQ